jgi:hypothetical protein
LTHRPRYIETARVPKLAEGPSSAVEPEFPAPAEAKGESAEVSKPSVIMVQEKTKMAKVPKRTGETEKTTEEPKPRRSAEQPKILSSSQETELSKMMKIPAATPKRRRMASVLDMVLESTKVPNLGEKNMKETAEAIMTQFETAAEPLARTETGPTEVVEKNIEEEPSDATKTIEESESPAVEASTEGLKYIVRHAAGKKLSEEPIAEAIHYAKDLKYPLGSLVFNWSDEDDFLYCLPDSKEISVCREMAENVGFPKLEFGLSAMS